MKNNKYLLEELDAKELSLYNGGSWFTRELFEDIGEFFAVLSDALAHDRESGIHGHI
jgi:hypothetical protein